MTTPDSTPELRERLELMAETAYPHWRSRDHAIATSLFLDALEALIGEAQQALIDVAEAQWDEWIARSYPPPTRLRELIDAMKAAAHQREGGG